MNWLSKIFAVFGKIGKDRYMHFTFGAIIASIAMVATCWLPAWVMIVAAVISVLTAGLIKDLVIDEEPDSIDILCTIGGGIAVWLPVILV